MSEYNISKDPKKKKKRVPCGDSKFLPYSSSYLLVLVSMPQEVTLSYPRVTI